jgi:FixJ family two-component response regulator
VRHLDIARDYPGPIHGVLSDVVMPHLNGSELAEALRTVRPATPVLFMSGFAGPLMTEQGRLEPGVTVVGKPFTSNDLLTAVYNTLAGATDEHLVPAGGTSCT